MQGVLLETFYGGSHKKWADEFVLNSRHKIAIISLSANHWKWRMNGGAISMIEKLSHFQLKFDFIIATDMLDVALFKALLPSKYKNTPIILYMHENQLVYPRSEMDKMVNKGIDYSYGFMNYTSMLASNAIWFNSDFHYNSWFNALEKFLTRLPDHKEMHLIEQIKTKSEIVSLGIDFSMIDCVSNKENNDPPILLWNHRWEYDKNPELFFNTLIELKEVGLDFKLIVLGERNSKSPAIFNEAHNKLKNEIIHWGYAESKTIYFELLNKADFIPVTSNQDFFGISTVEAIASGCTPLLPSGFAFPEHLPKDVAQKHLYKDSAEFKTKLIQLLSQPKRENKELSDFVKLKYNWSSIIQIMDSKITTLLS